MVFELAEMMADQSFVNEPWPAFTNLRDETPTHVKPLRQSSHATSMVLLSRFDDVRSALRSPAFCHPTASEVAFPDYARYPQVFEAIFSPRAVRSFDGRIRAIARELLAGIVGAGHADFHQALTEPFSSRVLLSLIGFADDEVEALMERKETLVHAEGTGIDDRVAAARVLWSDDVYEHFGALLDRWRRDPDSVATKLLRASFDGRPMTRSELIGELYVYLRAGVLAVTAALDCIITRLAKNAQLQHLARTDSERRPHLIEELLRIDSPVMIAMRRAAQATVCHDVKICQGDLVMLLLGAANTDERQFCDPLTIDLARNKGHLAFSTGVHRCLGAHLARLELSVALDEILRALGTFAIPAGTQVDFTFGTRWAVNLPLEWSRLESDDQA